eukprot:201161_1
MLSSLRKKRIEKYHSSQKVIAKQGKQEKERMKLIFAYCRKFDCNFPLEMKQLIISYHSFCDTWNTDQMDTESFNIDGSLNNCIECMTNEYACAYGDFIAKYNGETLYSWIIRITQINNENIKLPTIGVIRDHENILLTHYKRNVFPG